VWRVSGWHQLALATLTAAVFALSAVPLEIQRRIVNDAFKGGSFRAVAALAAAYATVALIEGLGKLGMNTYRGWVGERSVLWIREVILGHRAMRAIDQGVEISLVLAEAEPVGHFVGISLSEPLLQAGILTTVFGYMLLLQPLMALISLCIFLPQLLFVPALQSAINRRAAARILTLRGMSSVIAGQSFGAPKDQIAQAQTVLSLNMGIYKLKFSMNFLMNISYHASIAGVLALGGYYVVNGQTEVGTIVAFISGLAKINDPWGDLVNWFRDLRVTQTKYGLVADAFALATAVPSDSAALISINTAR
jgi:ABC-type multidrug transport system fused ATPase/permease subunit